MSQLPKNYLKFQEEHKEIYEAYEQLGEAAACCGPLNRKTRELVKLGMAAARQSESAVKSHTHRALETGATEDEIQHTVLLGITTIGFPAMMAALSWAQNAIEDHSD